MEINCSRLLLFVQEKLLKTLMKAFLLFCCTLTMAMGPKIGFSQDAKVTIATDTELSVDEVFEMIKRQTAVTFIYPSGIFNDHPKIALKKGVVMVGELLEKSFSAKDFVFEFNENNVIIKRNSINGIKGNEQETFTITGNVSDEAGNPLPGISVWTSSNDPKGETRSRDFIVRGTATDFDGNFTLQVAISEYLVATGLGLELYSVQITSRKEVYNIILKESQNKLDEVVVVGFGETKRADLTGSVATVKAKEIANIQPASLSVDQILGGQLAGVSVAQTSSRPGAGSVVNIRGQSTIRGANQPLYVIDGIPILVDEQVPGSFAAAGNAASLPNFTQQNPLLSVNPQDIESIDVLKDASAAAIYGSRAANGVILITTKKGRKNQRGTFNIDYNLSVQSAIKEYELMDRSQFIEFQNQIAQNTLDFMASNPNGEFFANVVLNNNRQFGNPAESTPYFGTGETDWVNELFVESAISQNIGINYTGGTNNTTYFTSISFADQEGLNRGTDFKNYAVRANVNSDVTDWIKIGTNISYSRNESEVAGSGALNYNDALNYQPTFDVRNEDDSFTSFIDYPDPFFPLAPRFNPTALLEISNENIGQNFTGSAFVELGLLEGLKWKTNFNVALLDTDSRRYSPVFLGTNVSEDLRLVSSETINTMWAHTLSYNRKFTDRHTIDAVLGMSFEDRQLSQTGIGANGFANDVLNGLGGASRIIYRFEDQQNGRLNSYFSRVNYNYDERYYLTFTSRYDGSTKFGPNNQYGFFPSGAVMWRISNEKFLEGNSVLSDLRLRTSLGRTGLANLPEFQFRSAYLVANGGNNQTLNGQPVIITNGIPNPDLQWETTDQLDIALQFGLFNDKVTGSINYYKNETSGLLMFGGISPTSGFENQIQNAADVTNKGWEIELGTNFNIGKLNWNSRFNIAANKNTLDRFNGGFINIDGSNPSTVQEGEPLGSIFGYIVDGIYQGQEEIDALNAGAPSGQYQDPLGMNIGDYRLRDVNGDGEITGDDRTVLGSVQPDFFGGWNNTLTFKGFDLLFNFQFSQGGERVFTDNTLFLNNYSLDRNNVVGALDDTWTPDNPNARYEAAIFAASRTIARERGGTITEIGEFDRNIFDTSYIRLKTLRFGYTLPSDLLQKLNLSTINFYVNVNNVFTITDWPGLDPEVVAPGDSNGTVLSTSASSGFDASPLTRTWTLGMRIGF